MLEFVTKETHKCPYCNSILLETSSFDGKEIWKICTVCNKRFEIAEFKKAQPWDVITLDDDIQWKENATCEKNAQVQKE